MGGWFAVGDALLFGMKRCPPCTHLERLTGVRLIKAMVDRGGINAAVFVGGEIREGDVVRPVSDDGGRRAGRSHRCRPPGAADRLISSTASTTIATPCPPPAAIAASPYRPARCRTSWVNSRTARTAPEAPHGWPSASAPPCGQTRSGSSPSSWQQARICPAKASLNSTTSMSSSVRPARSSAARAAGTSDSPRRFGSSPAVAVASTRRPGRPSRRCVAASARATTAAPSLIPQELPAVCVPPGPNAGRSRASRSTVSPARGRSSPVTPATGTISAAKPPACTVAMARACERAAYSSWAAREMPYSSARVSAAGPMSGSPTAAGANGARS